MSKCYCPCPCPAPSSDGGPLGCLGSILVPLVLVASLMDGCNRKFHSQYVSTPSAPMSSASSSSLPNTFNPALDEYVAFMSLRKLTEANLAGLSKSDLTVMRNAPYALHHYKFGNASLYDYFSRQRWYVPESNDAERIYDTFNPVERANVKLVLNYQNKHGLR